MSTVIEQLNVEVPQNFSQFVAARTFYLRGVVNLHVFLPEGEQGLHLLLRRATEFPRQLGRLSSCQVRLLDLHVSPQLILRIHHHQIYS